MLDEPYRLPVGSWTKGLPRMLDMEANLVRWIVFVQFTSLSDTKNVTIRRASIDSNQWRGRRGILLRK